MKCEETLLEDDDYDLNDDVAPEYDFAAIREQAKATGRAYHGQLSGRLIRLAPDVSEVFTTAEEVNEALRQFIREKQAA
jgi:hypothetical protein